VSTGLWIAVAAIVVALAFGAYRALTDGRFRGTHRVRGAAQPPSSSVAPQIGFDPSVEEGRQARLETTDPSVWHQLGAAAAITTPGERATLVQFSSAFCAPCRVTRRVLEDVAEREPGVVHLEIDAEHHLDVVRSLGIVRTPTTIVLDGAGHEVARAAGAPRREQVLAALPPQRLE
jgi:thiol-disulfide isomerase/thioredoxin